jgi:hypothetical protein
MSVEALAWQGVETQEYLLYFKLSQRSQAGQGELRSKRGCPGAPCSLRLPKSDRLLASVLRQGLHITIMRPLPRLESEPKSGAIFAQLFIFAALKG